MTSTTTCGHPRISNGGSHTASYMVSRLKEALELMSTPMLTVRVPGAAARQIRTADRPGPPLEGGQWPPPRVQHARSSPP